MADGSKQAEEQLRKLSRAVESAPVTVVITDKHGVIEYVNPFFSALTGYAKEEVLGKNPRILKSGKTPKETISQLWKTILGGHIWQGDFINRKKNGELYVEAAQISPILDAGGNITHFVAIKQDITERVQAEEALRESEAKFRGLVESTNDWIWEIDGTGSYTYASPQVEGILGYRPDDVIGKTPFDFMPTEEAERISAAFAEIAAAHAPFTALQNINLRKDGRQVILETSGSPIIDADGRYKGYRGIDRDITEHKRVNAELRASEEKFRKAVLTIPDSISINRLKDGLFVSINRSFTRILGYTETDVIGMTLRELDLWEDAADRAELVKRLRKFGQVQGFEARFRAKDGDIRHGSMSATMIDIDGVPHILSFTQDITERVRMQEALKAAKEIAEELATVDDLTGLYNRRGFFEICRREVGRLQRYNRAFSILFIDVDRFKQFNDRYSYEVGDMVLQQVAKALLDGVREIDVVGRYGGEEIVILLPEINRAGAVEVAGRLCELVGDLVVPFSGEELEVTVSIGVATLLPVQGQTIPASAERQERILDELIAKAGDALHLAKQKGRNRVEIYNDPA